MFIRLISYNVAKESIIENPYLHSLFVCMDRTKACRAEANRRHGGVADLASPGRSSGSHWYKTGCEGLWCTPNPCEHPPAYIPVPSSIPWLSLISGSPATFIGRRPPRPSTLMRTTSRSAKNAGSLWIQPLPAATSVVLSSSYPVVNRTMGGGKESRRTLEVEVAYHKDLKPY